MTDMGKTIENLSLLRERLKLQKDILGYGLHIDDLSSAIALLKEKEAKYPVCEKCGKEIDHIITSVFNYDGSDSDCSIPITYRNEYGCVSFSTSKDWTGYDLTDEEQKERIMCPYCGKFPFDDSEEFNFHESVEVLMWTSESRLIWGKQDEEIEEKLANDMRDYCEHYEPTYNPEDGSM